MYGATANAPVSVGNKGNRRQFIQQIIHNNGSGNILFSSGGISSAMPGGRRATINRPVATGFISSGGSVDQY